MIDVLLDPNNPVMWLFIISLVAGAIAVISRPFSSYVKFVYPNAKYEAMGNPYLNQTSLQKLLETGSLQGFIEQLNNNKDYPIQGKNASEVQHQLDLLYVKTIEQMKNDNSKKMHSFYDTIIECHDLPIMKTVIKLKRKQKNIDESLIQQPISKKIKSYIERISNVEQEEFLQVLKDFGLPLNYIDLIKNEDTTDEEIDAQTDRFYMQQLHNVKVPYKCQQAKHLYIKRLIDIKSIELLLRAKQRKIPEEQCLNLFIDEGYEILEWKFKELAKADDITEIINMLEGTSYATMLKHVSDTSKTKSVQPYTDALSQYMLTIMKNISSQHYTTIGPSLRFIHSKETEITNLKIIAKGLSENMAADTIKPLLRLEDTK